MPVQKWTCEKCGKSFDTIQAAIDCESSHRLRPKDYQGSKLYSGRSNNNRICLIHESEQDADSWGCHINLSSHDKSEQYPEWVKSLSTYSWCRYGLVVWDKSIQTIAWMSASDALELITNLQTNTSETPLVIGEQTTVRSDHRSDHEPKYTLTNKISLDAAQANTLLIFLQANEPILQKMAKEHNEQVKSRLRQAYLVMIRAYLRTKAEEAAQAG